MMNLGCWKLLVRWKKVVIGAVLGGLLGFGGQFVVDFFYFDCEDPPSRDRILTMYQTASGQADANFRVWMPGIAIDRARPLIYQGVILAWLMRRGDIASRTALIVAFLSASAALAVDRKGRAYAVKISTRRALTDCSGAHSLPKNTLTPRYFQYFSKHIKCDLAYDGGCLKLLVPTDYAIACRHSTRKRLGLE
jgi:hypothetical protein